MYEWTCPICGEKCSTPDSAEEHWESHLEILKGDSQNEEV